MKSKKELENIKEEFSQLNSKLSELTDEEMNYVTGGLTISKPVKPEIKLPEIPKPTLPDWATEH